LKGTKNEFISTDHDQHEINHPELEALLEGKSTSNPAGLGEETANTTSKRKTPPHKRPIRQTQ
jgi:hypothetical protein